MTLLSGGKASEGAESEGQASSTIPVTCNGVTGRLAITADSGVAFGLSEENEEKCASVLACCGQGSVPFEIKQEDLIGGSMEGAHDFRIWYCRHDGRKAGKPIRRLRKSAKMVCATEEAAAQAVQLLRDAALPKRKSVQRRLLVVLNPCSGRGRARKTFSEHVRPILEAAGFQLDVRETRGPGHATEIVREAQLETVDAVVAVGGDGTIFEILQGYFNGEDWEQRVKTPFCLVPSGSGNALAANCGLWTLETAAYAICKGRTRSLDIFSVVQPPSQRYFAFLSIYYGMMANLDHGTDHLRWMGSCRFTLGAIHEVLQQRRYAATVAYLPAASSQPACQDLAHKSSGDKECGKAEADALSTTHPSNNGKEQSQQAPLASTDVNQKATPGSCSSAGPPLPLLHALGPRDTLKLGSIAETHPGWQVLTPKETSFFAAVNLPLLDFNSRTGPEADFNSGCLDVVYVPEIASRKQGLEWLGLLGKGQHLEGNITHLRKARAMIIEPHSPGTYLVVDGEAIPYTRVYLEVHPSLCNAIVA